MRPGLRIWVNRSRTPVISEPVKFARLVFFQTVVEDDLLSQPVLLPHIVEKWVILAPKIETLTISQGRSRRTTIVLDPRRVRRPKKVSQRDDGAHPRVPEIGKSVARDIEGPALHPPLRHLRLVRQETALRGPSSPGGEVLRAGRRTSPGAQQIQAPSRRPTLPCDNEFSSSTILRQSFK